MPGGCTRHAAIVREGFYLGAQNSDAVLHDNFQATETYTQPSFSLRALCRWPGLHSNPYPGPDPGCGHWLDLGSDRRTKVRGNTVDENRARTGPCRAKGKAIVLTVLAASQNSNRAASFCGGTIKCDSNEPTIASEN